MEGGRVHDRWAPFSCIIHPRIAGCAYCPGWDLEAFSPIIVGFRAHALIHFWSLPLESHFFPSFVYDKVGLLVIVNFLESGWRLGAWEDTKGPSHHCFLWFSGPSLWGGRGEWEGQQPLAEVCSEEANSGKWLSLLGDTLTSWSPLTLFWPLWGAGWPVIMMEHLLRKFLNFLSVKTLKWSSFCLKCWHCIYHGFLALTLSF